jgi:DNA transposition AAA+ family ATPase
MNGITKKLVDNSGFKKKFIASHIGVSQGYLSRVLNQKAGLIPEKEAKLKQLLNVA